MGKPLHSQEIDGVNCVYGPVRRRIVVVVDDQSLGPDVYP